MTTPSRADALSPDETAAYLARIGAAAPESPTRRRSRRCTGRTCWPCPSRASTSRSADPIRLDRASLLAKVVGARRGGYCYELNGLFALLLRSLGYAVDLVSARVATADGGLTDDFDHAALVVSGGHLEEPVLADVGFGEGFVEPLPLHDGFERRERGHTVGLVRRDVTVGLPRAPGRRGLAGLLRLLDDAPPAGRLRGAQRLAADVSRQPFHPVAARLAAHPDRPRHPERRPAHHDDARPPRGDRARRRGTRAGRSRGPLRHRPRLTDAPRRPR